MSNQFLNKKFIKDLNAYVGKRRKVLDEVMENVVVEIVKTLVERTPYGQPENWSNLVYKSRVEEGGYQPGKSRGSWNVSFNSPMQPGQNEFYDVDGSSTVARARSVMQGYDPRYVKYIYITNTAVNDDTGEHYLKMIANGQSGAYPGYKTDLSEKFPEITYFWKQQGEIDSILGDFTNSNSYTFKYIVNQALVKAQ